MATRPSRRDLDAAGLERPLLMASFGRDRTIVVIRWNMIATNAVGDTDLATVGQRSVVSDVNVGRQGFYRGGGSYHVQQSFVP